MTTKAQVPASAQERRERNVQKLIDLLKLIQVNEVPGFDLNQEFDQSRWNSCIYGIYAKFYKLRVNFYNKGHVEDAKERFGFDYTTFSAIFHCDDHEYLDYEYYAKRALEVLNRKGYYESYNNSEKQYQKVSKTSYFDED